MHNNHINYQQNRLRPVIITFICFMVGLAILSVLGASGVFHHNPYGPEISVNNFSRVFKDVPEDTRDALFYGLYQQVAKNYQGEVNIKKLKANIRKDSISTNDSTSAGTTTSSFLVDIPKIEQSYRLEVTYPTKKATDPSIGYAAVVLCPTTSELIYPAFNCEDILSEDPVVSLNKKYSIMAKLPITLSYYSDDYSDYYDCTISYEPNDDYTDISFIITDRTGNCRDAATKKLQTEGIDTSKAAIVYNDVSSGYGTPR